MLKSVKWTEDGVVVVKICEGVFTLAQMRKNGLMEFFDVFRKNDNWEDVDLSKSKLIFCIFVAEKRLRSIFFRFLEKLEVRINTKPIIKEMLSFEWLAENTYTANLIELTDGYSSVGARLLKANLSVDKDLETIETHEFCGVIGDPEKLLARLKFFHETGVNWDEEKKFIYPSLSRPSGFPGN
ncbi:hypothetical protein [Pseudomonas huanghezhanensis]|uniref:hypothetical protein n=1 Tax=Pseudomonas huanghezhanensis TaxID=3002903 RepID=UPI002285A5EB|nr:hypothetical protein [Pseudomonas sp. BSw22131]